MTDEIWIQDSSDLPRYHDRRIGVAESIRIFHIDSDGKMHHLFTGKEFDEKRWAKYCRNKI